MDNRHIQFRFHEPLTEGEHNSLDLVQLQTLFQVTAFWAQDRSLEELAIALANSKPIVGIWDRERLIGFARATSDGTYRATIWDVVVHPDYQGSGLGCKLVETILSHPHVSRVERVYLMTTYKQQFYAHIGFQVNDTTTMVLYNQTLPETLPELGVPVATPTPPPEVIQVSSGEG